MFTPPTGITDSQGKTISFRSIVLTLCNGGILENIQQALSSSELQRLTRAMQA